MGKALIFDGITVTSPLQTITISIPDEDVERIVGFFQAVSSEQESALKTLVTTLKSNGIWNKLTYLMLPVFASSNIEAAQNVLQSSSPQSISNINKWTFNNGEFTQTSTGIVSLTSLLYNSEDMATQSLAMGVAAEPKTLPEGVSSEDIASVNLSQNGAIRIYTDNGGLQYNPGIAGASYSINASSIISGSSDATAGKYYFVKDARDAATERTFSSVVSTTPSFSIGSNSSGQYHSMFTGNLKLAWVSTTLTSTELVTAHTAFKKFIDDLESLSE